MYPLCIGCKALTLAFGYTFESSKTSLAGTGDSEKLKIQSDARDSAKIDISNVAWTGAD